MLYNSDTLNDYLAQENTQAFIKSAKSYIAFCEKLVKEPPSPLVLSKIQPFISDIFLRAFSLERIFLEWPEEFQELGPEHDGVYQELVQFFKKSIGSDTRCVMVLKPYQVDQSYSSFFVNELFTDLYLCLNDILYRIEVIATPTEIQAALCFLWNEIANSWGPECASLIAAYSDKSSDVRKIAFNISGQNLNLN